MKRFLLPLTLPTFILLCGGAVQGQVISGSIKNGNFDRTYATEIVPGFFLPKPQVWTYEGSRANTGPYQDGLSSEPWAGPAPTPVTTDGNSNPPSPEGCGGGDCAVFYKPFTGNVSDGAATVSLFQDNPATSGLTYSFSGWAGAEANFLGTAEFALEFRDQFNVLLSTTALNLNTAGLFVPNGEAFNYKQYTLSGLAPSETAIVRVRSTMRDAMNNPLGGGQALVVDDFALVAVPEPASVILMLLGGAGLFVFARRRTK